MSYGFGSNFKTHRKHHKPYKNHKPFHLRVKFDPSSPRTPVLHRALRRLCGTGSHSTTRGPRGLRDGDVHEEICVGHAYTILYNHIHIYETGMYVYIRVPDKIIVILNLVLVWFGLVEGCAYTDTSVLKCSLPIGDDYDPNLHMASEWTSNFVRHSYIYIFHKLSAKSHVWKRTQKR